MGFVENLANFGEYTSSTIAPDYFAFKRAIWPQWISQLEKTAKEFLPLDLVRKGILTTTYWDTTPIALNLKYAYRGFPNDRKWAEGGAFLSNKLLAQNENRPVLPGCEFVRNKSGLQKMAYDQFMSLCFGLDFVPYVRARIDDMFIP